MPTIFKRMTPTAIAPKKGSALAAGFDFSADIGLGQDVMIYPGRRALISTGIQMSMEPGTYMRIAPRSGLAFKNGIDVMAGVIDADYRGEIKILLINHGDTAFKVSHGDRIAQGIITKLASLPTVRHLGVDELLPETERGSNGFGSTGVALK